MKINSKINLAKTTIVLLVAIMVMSCNNKNKESAHAISIELGHTNLEIVKKLFHFMENKDLENAINGFTEEAVFAQPFNPKGADFAYNGKEEIKNGLIRIFGIIDTISYTYESYTKSADGSTVFVETKGEMTLSNGTPYNNSYVFRFDFNNIGKVTKVTEYMNSLYLAQTFGLIPSNK
jgi:ketosteroid isomerase-like protein